MTTALQVPPEQRAQTFFAPDVRLLVEHPLRWKEFPANLRAALAPRRGKPGFEEELGRVPQGALAMSSVMHVAMALALVFLFPRIDINFPVVLDEIPREQALIYYPVPSLPQVENSDAGEVRAAEKTRAAAQRRELAEEAFHPVQTIRVSRGSIIRPAVVDAPGLQLPRLTEATANILELPAAPAAAPQLATQPVELARSNSKLARTSREAEPAAPMPQRLAGNEKALPDLSIRTAVPTAAPKPVELARPKSKIARSAATQERMSNAPQLQSEQTVLPELALGRAPAVVVSVNSGDAIALPANGAPGSLAMSPEGGKRPNSGGEAVNANAGNNPAAGATVPGRGADSTNGAKNAGANADGNATTEIAGNGGTGKAGTPVIQGVVVRGGVVTLDSFGPKAPAANARQGNGAAAERPRRQVPVTVVATSRSGGGLNVYGVFKTQRVYTIYIDTTAGPVVFEFAARDAASDAAGELTAPDPVSAGLDPEQRRVSIVIACVLGVEGSLKDLRIVRGGAGPEAGKALLEKVATWRFHPPLSRGKPVEVDALIGIRAGVH